MISLNFDNKKKTRTVSTFLKKTFDLLNDHQNDRYIRWAASGIGFIITNQEQFSKNTLPKYFKHSNYSSFVRQLNMYNFHKIRQNSSESYFHHAHFDRNNRSALVDIHRKPQKKKKKNQQSEVQIEQNIQEMIFKTKKIVKYKKTTLANLSINMILDHNSQIKVSSQKNTQNIFDEQGLVSIRNVEIPLIDSDNLSVDVEEQRGQRRQIVATRELINASNNNIFPVSIQNVQTSILSIFY